MFSHDILFLVVAITSMTPVFASNEAHVIYGGRSDAIK